MSGQEQVLGLKEWYSLQVPEQHLNIEGLVEPTSGIKRQESEESEGGSSDVGVRGLQPFGKRGTGASSKFQSTTPSVSKKM